MEALTSLFELTTNLREYEVLADDAVATTLHLAANSWAGDNFQEVAASYFPLDKVNAIRKLKGVGKTKGDPPMKATDKQIKFILYLADHKGLNTTWMNASWKKVGVPMAARNGRVVDFLANLSVSEASNLIDRLQAL